MQSRSICLSDPFDFKARTSLAIISAGGIMSPPVRQFCTAVLLYGCRKPPTSSSIILHEHERRAWLAIQVSKVRKCGLKLRCRYGGPSRRWEACSAHQDFTCRTMARNSFACSTAVPNVESYTMHVRHKRETGATSLCRCADMVLFMWRNDVIDLVWLLDQGINALTV